MSIVCNNVKRTTILATMLPPLLALIAIQVDAFSFHHNKVLLEFEVHCVLRLKLFFQVKKAKTFLGGNSTII
jgi:hypothetical protein